MIHFVNFFKTRLNNSLHKENSYICQCFPSLWDRFHLCWFHRLTALPLQDFLGHPLSFAYWAPLCDLFCPHSFVTFSKFLNPYCIRTYYYALFSFPFCPIFCCFLSRIHPTIFRSKACPFLARSCFNFIFIIIILSEYLNFSLVFNMIFHLFPAHYAIPFLCFVH